MIPIKYQKQNNYKHMFLYFVVTVNPCDNNDCQNTASCVADATDSKGYRCICPSGFSGDKCESKCKKTKDKISLKKKHFIESEVM